MHPYKRYTGFSYFATREAIRQQNIREFRAFVAHKCR